MSDTQSNHKGKDDFTEWLGSDKGLTKKSVRDVISRLRRVKNYIDLSAEKSADEAVFRLNCNKEFLCLEMTIKSQMRRAARLFFEFKKSYHKKIQPHLF